MAQGKLTIHRVPRRILATLVISSLVFVLHLVGATDLLAKLGGADGVAVYVERAFDFVVVATAYMGWNELNSALKDPERDALE
jgi:hypothetical protein